MGQNLNRLLRDAIATRLTHHLPQGTIGAGRWVGAGHFRLWLGDGGRAAALEASALAELRHRARLLGISRIDAIDLGGRIYGLMEPLPNWVREKYGDRRDES